jgi:type I restriction enzyme S subunit
MMISEDRKLPDGWRRVELGEITSLVQNGVYKPAEKYGHGYPLLRMYNIQSTSFNLTFEPLARVLLDEQELETYKLKMGDVLVSRVNSFELVGKSAWVSPVAESYVFENMLIRLRFNDSVDSLFVALQMGTQAVRRQIEGFAKRASGQASINSSDIRNIQIVLPPLSYQKRVAAIAQKADRLRRTRRYALQLSDTYLRSVFLEMFGDPVTNPKGWDRARVADLGNVQTGNTPSRTESDNYGNYIEWIKSDNIIDGNFYLERSKEMLSEEGLKSGRFVDSGSILVTCIAGSATSIGNVALTNRKVTFNQQINALTPKKDVNSFFLYGLFLTCKPFVQRNTTLGMKRIITKSKFENLLLIKPPLPLQEKFAQIAQKFERLRTQQWEGDRQAEHLFQTLLHRAFRGELTPQHANDEPASVLLEEIGTEQVKAEAEGKGATQAMGDAAEYLGTKAKQQDTEPIQLTLPGME